MLNLNAPGGLWVASRIKENAVINTVIPCPKKIQKIYESRDTPLEFADVSIFSPEISKFCYLKKYRYRLYFDT